jgi:adenosylcobinamide-phosphate guanylyltransferase
MAGGRGTRLETDREKPLYPVAGRPLIDHVLGALAASDVEQVVVATSPATPETAAHVSVPTVETPGEGYVDDLDAALADERLVEPTLTVAADLPLLTGSVVDRVLDGHDTGSLTVAVPAARKRELGVSVDTTFERHGAELAPSGVNVVGGEPSETLVVDDQRLAVNVNRPADAAVAEAWLRSDC